MLTTQLTTQQLHAYLHRVCYQEALVPSLETLRQLHRAQVMRIPFENLDIFLRRPIQLDRDCLMTKLVEAKRGGYCFELNGLFFLVLQQLGFKVTPLAARVMQLNGSLTQKSHCITLVEIAGEQWLADVGFGANGTIEPLLLKPGIEFHQPLNTFRFTTDDRLGYVLQYQRNNHDWRTLYTFTLEESSPGDYEIMNYFASHSPDSLFTQRRLCVIPTPDAWVILNNNQLKVRGFRENTTIYLNSETAYRDALKHYFGIDLPQELVLNILLSTTVD